MNIKWPEMELVWSCGRRTRPPEVYCFYCEHFSHRSRGNRDAKTYRKQEAWWNQKQNKERIVNNKEKQNQTRQQFQNLLRHKSIGHYAAWWRHSDVLSTRLVLFPRLTNSHENTQNCITKLVAFDSINCLLSARHKAITLFKTVV